LAGRANTANRLLDSGTDRPDGLFCGIDQIARGACDALRERGIRVPEDVAIIGFDNWEVMTAAARPPLSSIDLNLKALGREAGTQLLAMMGGEVSRGVRRLPCTLIERESTVGRARAGVNSGPGETGSRMEQT